MDIEKQQITASGIKILAKEGDRVIGRAYLYILKNDLHEAPFGLMEDVFVEQAHRKQGVGKKLVEAVMIEAKNRGCYKLICTSRESKPEVHTFYEKCGLKKWGHEFRIEF